MAKNSGYLARLQAQKNEEIEYYRRFSLQWCADAAILAAHEVFQRRGEKIAAFYNAFVKYANQIAEMTMKDAKDDKHIDYTKGTLDKRLLEILGEEYFRPWEERYDV